MRNVVIFEKKNTPRNFKALKNTKKVLGHTRKKKKINFNLPSTKKYEKKIPQKNYKKNIVKISLLFSCLKKKKIEAYLAFPPL